ncbi:MAG: GNAT family N-acetyltransferase [Lachnospiraceae bacterium]|nr:GNAT family N-acetyltransferase [Lachnospiraceae bacterium]
MKLFDEIPALDDGYLKIGKIEEKDAAVLEEMSANDNVRKFLPTFLFEYRFADKHEAVKEMYGSIFQRKESLILGIFLNGEEGRMAGVCEIYNYDPHWNKASIGCRLNEEFWNRKIASHVIMLLKDYLFEKTDVKRITVHVMTDNIYSCRAVEKCGFRLRKSNAEEDWGFEKPVRVNKYVLEKLGNIKYCRIGNGPKPMVMLPGLALKSTLGSADIIEENYAMFADYSIYLFDDRDNIGDGYTIRERAGDIAAEMKTLHLKHAYVFGASMGGMVGQYLAIDHPDLVDRLVISATSPCMNELSRKVVTEWRDLAIEGNVAELVSRSIRRIYSENTIRQWGTALEQGIGYVSPEELSKFIKLSDAILRFDCRDELDRIRCRTLVMGSEGDRVLGVMGAREIAARTGGRLYVYGPEYGHGFYDEAPDHRQRILDFFDRAE